jgi:predicted GNAT family acetyltransferase
MEREPQSLEIKNNESAHRFETRVDAHEAFVQYRYSDGGDLVLSHTEVPPALGGKGLGGKLAAAALDYARSRRLRVVVTCPFITNYMNKHPEYRDLLRKEYGE